MTFYQRLRYQLTEAGGLFVLAAAVGMVVVAIFA